MRLKKLKEVAAINAKNLVGWKTKRKIVVFSVDDYGNVRICSKEARNRMEQKGLKVLSPFKGFDMYDSLENKLDLEMLFDVLTSVKDQNGRNAVFTPFVVPCNIDFEKIEETEFSEYYYEKLPETFRKMSWLQPQEYKGAWDLWLEGIRKGILFPQFHGREHLNLKLFNEKLKCKDQALLTSLRNRSFARIPSNEYSTISAGTAFDFWNINETETFREIIEDGLNVFEEVFGYRAVHFNPPGGREHPVIHGALKDNGIKYIDTPLLKKEHQGSGKFKTFFNYTGKKNGLGQTYIVRNVVFEPTNPNRGLDWVAYALDQIEAAFRWNRPAIISSHRVNFCGHIEAKNRKQGLNALKALLQKIVQRWPEVEFMAANELGALIESQAA